jgi:RNA polymerase sigma factor (sigma-70 family)
MIDDQLSVRLRYLVQQNRGLAHFAVKQIWHSWRVRAGFAGDFDEAVSVAYMGLIRAAQYFDPAKAKFSTLAVLVIRRMVMSEAVTRRACIRVPQAPALEGRRVHVEHLVEDSPRYIQREPEQPAMDLSDEWTPAGKALRHLPEREQHVVSQYYMHDQTLAQIGQEMHLTRERVRQLRDQGMASMRAEMGVAPCC